MKTRSTVAGINFEEASFKNFENIEGYDMYARAGIFNEYLNFLDQRGHLNYRMEAISGCGPEMEVLLPGQSIPQTMVGLVSNDYLGFTQHPKVKAAVIEAVQQYGTGAGASPAIGGHFNFHQRLEEKIARFFKRDSAILYTTGYTANSATFQCLLQKEDIAILDMAVHASVFEGCQLTNIKRFPHNNLEMLELVLKQTKGKYRNRMVIIDGVYSQDGDLAPLDKILELTKSYGAFLAIDDAHGTGVIGRTGRGVLELYDLFDQVDLITGTFSKTFAHVGGYIVGNPELIRFLKFQSRQHLFSATSSPAAAGIIKAIELVDEEPHWQSRLWDNIEYFKKGLIELGFDVGNTQSAIIPVKIGDPRKTGEAGRLLLDYGVYSNPIIYPAVSKNDARIRMSLMATHTRQQLDKTLNAFADVDGKIGITNQASGSHLFT
ncbi:MAG: 2-amino-3-ketobutyrate CoA ligase [Mucilaginibacter sp.]|nr:MAG: 2-amino-3-ketobutyrate CoA ligase [Mucilaginibacter sp.]HEK18930.1 aminotransferase class I/II-fold pyridoxal phosphate-dependent enzyme [Bacteroidota bacterium]